MESTLFAKPTETISRYKLISELGRGSMGRVYLAEDPNIERRIALKVLLPSIATDDETLEDFQKRFVTEAKAAGRLNHPCIVTVYDAGMDPNLGCSYIAMEWIEGESLDKILHREKRLAPATAISLASQVALALDYAHHQGVVHRDIKPANILVSRAGPVKVLDFGIAKLNQQGQTLAGQVLGTPAFMSPEQIRSLPLDGRSDLFSLGTILYECLSGQNPFAADSVHGITYKIVSEPIPSLAEIDPGLPAPVVAVVERALHKDRGERFQTGADMAEALVAAREHLVSDDDTRSDIDDSRARLETAVFSSPLIAPIRSGSPSEEDELADLGDIGSLGITGLVVPENDTAASTEVTPAPSPVKAPTRSLLRHGRWALPAVLVLGLVLFLATRSPDAADREETGPGVAADVLAESATEPGAPQEASSAPQETPAKDDEPESSAPSSPIAEPAASAEEKPPPQAADATLEILYSNRLAEAEMTVDIDGQNVWTQELTNTKKLFGRLRAEQIHAILPVAAGRHTVRVHITSASAGIDTSGSHSISLGKKETLQLRVELKRKTNELVLGVPES